MRLRAAPFAASAVLAVFVVACGGSATPAPSVAPSVAASVAATVAPSVAPSLEPSPSPAPSADAAESPSPAASGEIPSFAIPSFETDKDLEAVLPGTFGGVTLQKISFKGSQFLDQDPTSDFNKAVVALGLSTANVSVAAAGDPSGTGDVQFVAIRFAGAESGKLLQVFQAASQASGDLVGSINLGGKDVLKTNDSNGGFSYFYVRGDVVLGVTAPNDTTAAAALAVLP